MNNFRLSAIFALALISSDASAVLAFSPGVQVNSIDGNPTPMLGGNAHWLLNQEARIGVEGWVSRQEVSPLYGRFAQLGGSFMRVYDAQSEVGIYNELFVGAGQMLRKANALSQYPAVRDRFVLLEPGLGLNVPLSKHLALQAGLRYRWVTKVDILGTSENDLYGVSLNARIQWLLGGGSDPRIEPAAMPGSLTPELDWPPLE
ncbi:MAG: hypothetical protein OEW58_07685 [Gammaproteobacteria bacterium]|nr:hypothetical protein [Gammaproteobacteria bacterium]